MTTRTARRPPLIRQTHHLTLLRVDFISPQPPEISRPHRPSVLARPQECRLVPVEQTWTAENCRRSVGTDGWACVGRVERELCVSKPRGGGLAGLWTLFLFF